MTVPDRAAELLREHQQLIYARTDRLFAVLMMLQWAGAVIGSLLLSPQAWEGDVARTHPHVWAALMLGGALTVYPVFLAMTRSGRASTRHVIAAAQVLMSSLLIHISGGRIETHFHVFGSLAFLAFYRDWRVFIPATAIVTADHVLRGLYMPESVFGVLSASIWRTVEHAAWVLFEDAFLIVSCVQSVREMRSMAERRAEIESLKDSFEAQVKSRTDQMLCSEKMSAVGQLAAGVAHEINNPLAVILGFSQTIVKRMDKSDPLLMPIQSIEREANRCKHLVQDLLTFSRAGRGQREPMDLNQAVVDALALVGTQARLEGVEVRSGLTPSIPKILGNPNQIQQIVINLCNNAIDAMAGGGTLSVSTALEADASTGWVALRIVDSGSGIPPEVRARIFEPFFTTKQVGKGTGLGLSLAFEIVKKHSGTIDCESRPGRTEFLVRLPVPKGAQRVSGRPPAVTQS